MPSALIHSAGRQPAMLLAEQLAHESCVRPGPLVLGTAPLKSPTPTTDRDRHICYRRPSHVPVPVARSFLPGSACRHAGRTISSPFRPVSGNDVRRMVSEDSRRPFGTNGIESFLLIDRTDRIVTAPLTRNQYRRILGVSSI